MRRKNIFAAIRHRRNLIAKTLRLKIFQGKKTPSQKLYRRTRAKVSGADLHE